MFIKHQAPTSSPTSHKPASHAQFIENFFYSSSQVASIALEEEAGVAGRAGHRVKEGFVFFFNDEKERNMFKNWQKVCEKEEMLWKPSGKEWV